MSPEERKRRREGPDIGMYGKEYWEKRKHHEKELDEQEDQSIPVKKKSLHPLKPFVFPENLDSTIIKGLFYVADHTASIYYTRNMSFKTILKNHAFTFPYSGRYIGLKDFFKRAVEQSKEIVDMYSGIFHVLAKLRESEGLKKVKATDSKSLYKLIILAGGLDPNSYKALYSEPFWEFKKKLDAVWYERSDLDRISVKPKSMNAVKEQADKDKEFVDQVKSFGQKFLSLDPDMQESLVRIIFDYNLESEASDNAIIQAKEILASF